MKVVLLLSRIELSGVTTHTLTLAEGLIEEGHEVLLITGGIVRTEDESISEAYSQFRAKAIAIKEFKTPNGNLFGKAILSIISILQIIRWINSFKPQVIHCQSPYMTFIPWMMNKHFTTTMHQVDLIKNFKFKNPTHLIAISQESLDFSKNEFNIKEESASIIHHGISKRFATPITIEEKNQLKQKYNIPNNKLVIGYAGSISRRKGHDILIEAIKNLNPESLEKIHLVFLGGSTKTDPFAWLQQLVLKAAIDKYTSCIPFEDPKPFYDIFDIFVLPSRMESFPLVTIEAMMSGCCVLRSNTEGSYEQIDHGTNGLLFENENHQQLTSLLTKVINENNTRKELGANAKQKALEDFTIPVMARKTIAVYEKCRLY